MRAGGNMGDFYGMAIGEDGAPRASFVDPCPNDERCTSFGVTNPRGEGVVGQLVGGEPLRGTAADQRPGVDLPLATPPAAGARRCVSRRNFSIRLREPRRGRLRSALVFVDGKRVRILRGRRLRARVDLRGLPAGRYKVRIVAETTTGRRIVRERRYRTCARRPGSRR